MPWSHARRDRTGRVLLQRASAISYACEERDQLGTSPRNESSERVLGTSRGLHAAVISRGIMPVNSERFHQDLLKVAFGQGYIYKPRLVRFLIMTSIIAILRYGDQ